MKRITNESKLWFDPFLASECQPVIANNRSGRLATFVELVVCQLGLLIFGFLCFRFFSDPSELLRETGFEDLPKAWQIILGRALLSVLVCGGAFLSIRSVLRFSRAAKA